ncbi:MAG: extracellular solute-binding protein [Acholeplasmatales bacterium]|jgi:multiple sugar transport system substrate-binding protein|nr:extracellular solute-binding protein [Acholeplasmatales bacterium]
MKKLLLLFVLVLGAVVLVGCKRPPSNDGLHIVPPYDLPETADYNGSSVTIKFWHRMGAASQLLIQSYITEFNAIYPNIHVVEEKPAADYVALAEATSLAISAGDEPDIVESYPDHVAKYAEAKAPLPLNSFISNPNIGFSAEEIADFLPGLWAEGKTYDKAESIMSLPFSKSSEAFFYNKTYFDAHNYTVPETWEELFALAEIIKSSEAALGHNVMPFGYDSEDNLFITASAQKNINYTGFDENGKGRVLFNNEDSKNMMRYFKEKYNAGLMTTRSLNNDAYSSDLFKVQNLYMEVGSTGGTRYNIPTNRTFEVGVAPVPYFEGGLQKQIQQGPNISLFKKTGANAEQRMIAAWLFAKFLTSPEKTAKFATESGYIPVRQSAFQSATYLAWEAGIKENPTTDKEAQDRLVRDVFNVFLASQDRFFTSIVFNLGAKTRTEVGKLLAEILAYPGTGADLDKFINDTYRDHYNYIIS